MPTLRIEANRPGPRAEKPPNPNGISPFRPSVRRSIFDRFEVDVRGDVPYPGYKGIAPVEVSDANLMGVFGPRRLGGVDEKQVLQKGFAEPVGAARLRDAARGSGDVLILIDDGTRGTPVARLLPY